MSSILSIVLGICIGWSLLSHSRMLKMIGRITSKVIKRTPYVGPIIQEVGIAFDTKEIVENLTLGAVKTIIGRFVTECTTSKAFHYR